jgi:hypothetical protein
MRKNSQNNPSETTLAAITLFWLLPAVIAPFWTREQKKAVIVLFWYCRDP